MIMSSLVTCQYKKTRKEKRGGRESVVVCLKTTERSCFSFWIVSFEATVLLTSVKEG